jgi:hypothetical protein
MLPNFINADIFPLRNKSTPPPLNTCAPHFAHCVVTDAPSMGTTIWRNFDILDSLDARTLAPLGLLLPSPSFAAGVPTVEVDAAGVSSACFCLPASGVSARYVAAGRGRNGRLRAAAKRGSTTFRSTSSSLCSSGSTSTAGDCKSNGVDGGNAVSKTLGGRKQQTTFYNSHYHSTKQQCILIHTAFKPLIGRVIRHNSTNLQYKPIETGIRGLFRLPPPPSHSRVGHITLFHDMTLRSKIQKISPVFCVIDVLYITYKNTISMRNEHNHGRTSPLALSF